MGSDKDKLKKIFKDSGVYDADAQYFYLDRIWYSPSQLSKTTELIYKILFVDDKEIAEMVKENKNRLVILSPNNIGPHFGVMPISINLAEKIGCDIAVWKELYDIKFGSSSILGRPIEGQKCIVIQDVINRGTNALKMAYSIKDWNWEFYAYIGIVENTVNGDEDLAKTIKKLSGIVDRTPIYKSIFTKRDFA